MAELSTLPLSAPAVAELSSVIGIIGTGDFARGLATRCFESGVEVCLGSRHPEARANGPKGDILTKVRITSVESCIKECDVIVVALHHLNHVTLQRFDDDLAGKIVVDVSNSLEGGTQSIAERLSSLLPSAHVIKAFNTLSAYAMLSTDENNLPVYVCGDDVVAKGPVMSLAGRLGFSPVDGGPLSRALVYEKRNRELFPGWGLPTVVLVVISIIWTVLALLRYFDWRRPPYTWERLPTNVVNKIVGCISITCLCLVYLPGIFAGFTQLCWGTKHRRFQKSLDNFLKMRKPLGLYALLFGLIHMVMSTVLLSPAYYSKWYITKTATVPGNLTDDFKIGTSSRMNAVGETCVLLGVLAISTMSILGVTSIPSVARGLNWREWRFVQSYLGFVCLLFATAHVTVKGATSWINEDSYKDYMATVTFFSLPLPWFTILLKILIMLPCCHYKLKKIREGLDQGDDDIVKVTRAASSHQGQGQVVAAGPKGQSNGAFVA